jgi:hypothetical protein
MFFVFIHTVAQFLARLEMRHELAIQADRLACLGIAPYPG